MLNSSGRLLIVAQPVAAGIERYELDFVAAVQQTIDCEVISLEEWFSHVDSARLGPFDAVLFFVALRDLEAAQQVSWHGFGGLRAMLDFDAFHDFTVWGGVPGRSSAQLLRHGFDLIVCSGIKSQEHFAKVGIEATVIHKGFAPERFADLQQSRSGLVHMGSPYRARSAMLRTLRGHGIDVSERSVPYPDANVVLNQHLAMVTTVLGARARFGKLGRAVERVRPGTVLSFEPAPEPMAKHFEASAAGCVPMTDFTPDLAALGFVPGETVVVFDDFTDLAEKCRHYLDHPDELRLMGRRAAQLCLDQHTWRHRALALQDAMFSRS